MVEENKKIEKKEENKIVDSTTQAEVKKEEKKEIIKKDKATIKGLNLPISTKNAIYTCDYIRGKTIEEAVKMLEKILTRKAVLPMRGEIPHRKGPVTIGRYPINSTKVFIKLLKSLNANAQVNGIENPYIASAVPNLASRPYKRFGSQRFKRTHVYLEAKEKKI